MVLFAEQNAQLTEQPAGVRIVLGIGIDGRPEQAIIRSLAPPGAETHSDQLSGELPALPDVTGSEQAVMGEAQRFR